MEICSNQKLVGDENMRRDIFGNVIIWKSTDGSFKIQKDHWWPFALGGQSHEGNCVAMHWKVNNWKSDHEPTL